MLVQRTERVRSTEFAAKFLESPDALLRLVRRDEEREINSECAARLCPIPKCDRSADRVVATTGGQLSGHSLCHIGGIAARFIFGHVERAC